MSQLYYVHCKGDKWWLKDANRGVFTKDKRDAVTVDRELGERFTGHTPYTGAYELVPVEPSEARRNPELQAAIDEGIEALKGDSNDAEHDALVSLLNALGIETGTL